MICWGNKTTDTMDRFDCRLLLDSYADVCMGSRLHDAVLDESDALCEEMRWKDVVLNADGSDSNALPDDDASPADADDAPIADAVSDFLAASTFSLPTATLTTYSLPYFTAACAQRPLLRIIHIIISRTARLVALCGARLDTMLRIRHGALPCLQFLYPDNKLRPYFDAMVEVGHTVRPTSNLTPHTPLRTTRVNHCGKIPTIQTAATASGPST